MGNSETTSLPYRGPDLGDNNAFSYLNHQTILSMITGIE